MATLNAAARRNMKPSQFGMPKTHGFPMNDPEHDRLAIGGATRAYNAGNISKGTEERLKAEARAKLGIKPKRKSLYGGGR